MCLDNRDAITTRLIELYDEWESSSDWLDKYPTARDDDFGFLVAAICDRQMPAQKAWTIPDGLKELLESEDLGDFSAETVSGLHANTLEKMLRQLGARYPKTFAKSIKKAARVIMNEYEGDASSIYEARSALEVYHRLRDLHGIGPKIAAMLVRILHDQCDYGYRDMDYIGLPGDRQNARVMYRLGLIDSNDVGLAVDAALRLAGKDARKLDSTFGIGQAWCTAKDRRCEGNPATDLGPCPMLDLCPKFGL